jgi:hypothetical protein
MREPGKIFERGLYFNELIGVEVSREVKRYKL